MVLRCVMAWSQQRRAASEDACSRRFASHAGVSRGSGLAVITAVTVASCVTVAVTVVLVAARGVGWSELHPTSTTVAIATPAALTAPTSPLLIIGET